MLKRFVVGTLVVAGASALASIGVIVAGPAAHGVTNVCASVKGTPVFQSGTASCQVVSGTTAVGVGAFSDAAALGTNKNTATAVGDAAGATVLSGTKNRATSVGSPNAVVGGTNNSATAVGSNTVAALNGGNKNTAIAARDGCTVTPPLLSGSKQNFTCP